MIGIDSDLGYGDGLDGVRVGAGLHGSYEFAWRSPQYNGLLGTCHALEVPFVLDILDDKKFQLLTGPNAPQQLADTVHAAWAAFATKGDTGWPRYDLSRRATMRFNTTSEVVNDPRPFERALWDCVR